MTNNFKDNIEKSRFELEVESKIVFADYRKENNIYYLNHVESPIELRGKGAAGNLMSHIVDYAKKGNFKLYPICTYAVAWLRKHKEFHDLIA